MWRLVWRLATSAALVGLLLVGCSHLPHVSRAMVALLMVVAIVGLATKWGWAEALTGAIIGGVGFDYYFLLPRGIGIANPEDWVDLAAFMITALITGQLAARAKRHRIQATEKQLETEKLYRLVNALLESGSAGATLAQLAEKLVDILEADGVALYDKHTGQTVRSGPRAAALSDYALHETATSGRQVEDATSALSLAPIRHSGELAGSIGISGVRLSEPLLSAVAGRVGLGLARLYAIERTTEAEAIRRSEELKSAVLDTMAHEIRNPLNSVKLAATTLLSGQAGSAASQREMLTIIDEEANRMDHAIDEAVLMARMDADGLALKKEPQNMDRLISAAIDEMRALASGRHIQVRIPKSLPAAECDNDMIARVLKQLVSNALKYSPSDSPLTVSAGSTGAAIVIDVVDRGPGIAEDEQDRIFEKYYRGRAACFRAPGMGLGLSSARSIVQAHGGELWVTTPPGGGAAFHVSLPAANASVAARR